MGLELVHAERRALRLRIASSLVLAPLPLIAIWLGGLWLALLAAFAGAVMAWEWGRLCRGPIAGRFVLSAVEMELIGIVITSVFFAAGGAVVAAITVAILGAVLVFATTARTSYAKSRWTALGVLWVTLPCICFLWLARDRAGGRATLLWLLAVVWATDIGAYVIGRSIGGPRLAPRWSPRKTWAGLVGGMACAAVAGAATALLLGGSRMLSLVLISAGLAIVAQFGDLAESLAKRRFGVKDSSALIPGHGGLLDRLDGLLAVVPAVALISLAGGRSVLAWQ
jgi:phosphatidate cytidylyltransferase